MTPKNILFLNGLPDNRQVEVNYIDKNNTMHYALRGSANIAQMMDKEQIIPSIVVFDTHLKQDMNAESNIHAIFNEISDADTHFITLAKAQKLYNMFSDKMPFFNKPDNIMKTSRSRIYQLLHDIKGLHVPKTVQIQPKSASDIYDAIEKEGLEFPVILRKAGEHNGIGTLLIEDDSEQFYAFALNGQNHYLTQFVEYADEDGIYAKYRLVVVDGEVFIRHIIFSDHWKVHQREFMEKNLEFQEKEIAIFQHFDKEIKPKIQPIITEINQQLGLDYFGIDCTLDENFNITLFEANANMDILTHSNDKKNELLTKKIQHIEEAVSAMINNRLKNKS